MTLTKHIGDTYAPREKKEFNSTDFVPAQMS
jgi:hypothetical protein